MAIQYPRALPYRSAEERVTKQAPSRRCTVLRLTAAAGLVVLSAAAGAFVMSQLHGGEAPTAPAPPPPVAVARPSKPSEATLASVLRAAETKDRTIARDAATIAPGLKASSTQETFLEALGGLSAAHLYQSYLNIGLIADSVEAETQSREEAEKMLQTVVDLMGVVEKQLARLSQTDLGAEDRAALERIKTVSGLLSTQADQLRVYWADQDTAQAREYHETRRAAWDALKSVLGFK
jgi:hypothetical protein